MTMDETVMKVEHFSKLGTQFMQQGQLQKALEAYTNAYESAQTLGHHGYMQRACAFNLGAMLISVGSYSEGLMYLKLAAPPEGHRDGKSNGDLYFNYGLAYEGLKNPLESKHYFMKALQDYRLEKNNLKMEADTISHIGKIYVANCQFSEAESLMKQLVHIYDSLGDHGKKLQAQADRANLLIKDSRVEEAEHIANDCFKGAEYLDPNEDTVNVLIELSLAYTQMCKYDKALESCQKALSVVKSTNTGPKYETVLYQNLGVIYNYSGQFEEALKYHKAAAKRHAELKNRKSQGHCFMNMGHAYSKLKNMEMSRECFMHALQAAKDSGDHRSEWQIYEALGSVAYHQGLLKQAQDYYKQSLTVIAKSGDLDNSVQERIMGKLTCIIQLQVQQQSRHYATTNVVKQVEKPATEEVIAHKQEGKQEASPPHLLQRHPSRLKRDGSVIVVKKGGKIKYLRVRRSGTLRRFKKVALGLDTNFSSSSIPQPIETPGLKEESEEEILSAYTTGISDLEEESDDRENSSQRHIRPLDSLKLYYKLKEETESDQVEVEKEEDGSEVSDREIGEEEEYLERKQVLAAMKSVIGDHNKMVTPVKDGPVKSVPVEDESDEESDDDSISYSGTVSSSNEEEETKAHNKKRRLPPVPSMSPEATVVGPVRTYEIPIKELHYETIDHHPANGSTQDSTRKQCKEGERVTFSYRPSDDDGTNYFHSGDERLLARQKSNVREEKRKKENRHEIKDEEERETLEGTIYESTPSAQRWSHSKLGEDRTADGDEQNDFESLPKGKKDTIMFKAHQADLKRRNMAALSKASEPAANQKSSRHCIIM